MDQLGQLNNLGCIVYRFFFYPPHDRVPVPSKAVAVRYDPRLRMCAGMCVAGTRASRRVDGLRRNSEDTFFF